MLFDGTDDSINVDSVANDIQTGSITMSAWVNFTSDYNTGSAVMEIFRCADDPSDNDVNLQFGVWDAGGSGAAGAASIAVYSGTAWQSANSAKTSWTAGKWFYIVGVFSTVNGMTIYVNGVSDGTNSNTSRGSATFATNARIGRSFNAGAALFAGNIANVRIWNRALSADEVLESMACMDSPSDTFLQGFWSLMDSYGQYDMSVNNNDGSPLGGVVFSENGPPSSLCCGGAM